MDTEKAARIARMLAMSDKLQQSGTIYQRLSKDQLAKLQNEVGPKVVIEKPARRNATGTVDLTRIYGL